MAERSNNRGGKTVFARNSATRSPWGRVLNRSKWLIVFSQEARLTECNFDPFVLVSGITWTFPRSRKLAPSCRGNIKRGSVLALSSLERGRRLLSSRFDVQMHRIAESRGYFLPDTTPDRGHFSLSPVPVLLGELFLSPPRIAGNPFPASFSRGERGPNG